MRTFLSVFLFLLISQNGIAQSFNQFNSVSRIALVEYSKDKNGFYQKNTNYNVDEVDNIISMYAFDKKHNNLYVATSYGNYVITLIDSEAKNAIKLKSLPKLKESEIEALVLSVNNSLDNKIARLNLEREQFITDSIESEKEKARLDSIKAIDEQEQLNKYRSQHNYHWLPIKSTYSSNYSNSFSLKCGLCDKSLSSHTTDSIFVMNIYNDTIYSIERKEGNLGLYYNEVHAYKIPYELAKSSKYLYHLQAFSDSLIRKDKNLSNEIARAINYKNLNEHIKELTAKAPNGFVIDWGWDSEYSMVTFSFKYMNLNKKTIKYLDVYWIISNDVGDVRLTGHFKGTGPVDQYQSASWIWDSSSYFVAGDATTMNITKIIITYMNGQQQTISQNKIVYQ